MEELPHKVRIETSMYINLKTYTQMNFLHDKSISFIAWVCPLFKHCQVTEN